MPAGRMMATCAATSTTVVRMKMILALLIATPPGRPRTGALLEANVLQCFCRLPVQPRCVAVVVPPGGEIAEREPGGGPVAGRSKLFEAPIGGAEDVLSLV